MPKGIISMGRAQFQTRQNSASPMSPLGCDVIVPRSLPRRRPRIRRHLGWHFTRRFGECWTLRPNPARCFGARPWCFTSIPKPEVVNTSAAAAARNRARSRHAGDTARFPSPRLIDAGASSGTPGSAIRGWIRCAAAPFESGRPIGTPGRPLRLPIRVRQYGRPEVARAPHLSCRSAQ
jgi:hypothetical protein